jgi:hypothetical protein
MMAISKLKRAAFPSPREPLRAVGRVDVEDAGVGGDRRKKEPPAPDPSPPLRCATRRERRR